MHNILQMVGLGENAEWKIVGSVQDLEPILLDATNILKQVGQLNLHYTCHHVTPNGHRSFDHGEWLFFDFDKIDNYTPDLALKFRDALVLVLGIDPKHIWVISSGHGVHLLIKINPYDLDYLEIHKSTYSAISAKLEETIESLGLTGEVDPIFHRSKSLRLPNTTNRKEGKADVRCELIQRGEKCTVDILTLYRQSYDPTFDLLKELGQRKSLQRLLPALTSARGPSIAPKESIIEKCGFVQKLRSDMAYSPREEWLRAVGFLTTLGMEEEAHLWSQNSATYKSSETEQIIVSAKEKGLQPTSCAKIKESYSENLTSSCDTCPVKACRTPAALYDDTTGRAMAKGFYLIAEKDGEQKRVGIDYTELGNYCNRNLHTLTIEEYDEVYSWDFNKLQYFKHTEHSMARLFYDLLNPQPSDATKLMMKGMNTIKIHHRVSEKEMLPPDGYIPLKNGWLNCTNGDLEPYSPLRFVTEKIPVLFDPTAKCPNFEKFLQERVGDPDTIKMLLQYICYALAGIKQPNRRILVLEGPPGTGKTTLVHIFSKLFGEYYALAQLQHLAGRFELSIFENRRLIYFDEAPQAKDNILIEVLKTLSGSSDVRIERKNENSKTIQNYARMIISCNEIPRGGAMDSGFMDRLLIIPMHNQIDPNEQSGKLVEENLFSELSGILNLVLAEFKTLSENKFQIKPTEVTKLQSDIYQEENDPVAQFFFEEITLVPAPDYNGTMAAADSVIGSPLRAISLKDLKNTFTKWCESEAPWHNKMSSQQLKKRIETLSKTLYRKKGQIYFVEYNRKKFLCGVQFVNKTNYSRPDIDDDRF
jgi:P4 family phage/plasmid primase-like protien